MKRFLLFFISIILVSCDFTSTDTYFAEATKCEEQNNLKEAIKLHDKAILRDENYLPAYINRAADNSILGNYKSAIQDYTTVLKKNPQNTLALLNRGKNKHRLCDYAGAILDFDAAIKTKGGEYFYMEMKPNDFTESGYDCSMQEIRLERAVSLYFVGDLKKSYSDVQFCLEKNYERKIALYWRAMLLIAADKNDLACKDLQESSNLGNNDADQEIKRFCK